MTTTAYADHLKSVSQESHDLYLGFLCWYTVRDARTSDGGLIVSRQELQDALHATGLSDVKPPKEPNPNDLFRRVTTQAKITRQPTGRPNEYSNFKFVNISGRDNEIVRRLVKETIDEAGRRLSYEQLVDMVFNKATQKITVTPGVDYNPDDQDMLNIVSRVKHSFRTEKDMVTAEAMRQFVKNMLLDIGSTSVRDGGVVNFVTQSRDERLHKIENFVNEMPPQFASFHSLPLVDNEKQRGMVRQAFEDETANATSDLMVRMKELRQTNEPIHMKSINSIKREYADLVVKTEEYEGILEDKLSEAQSRLMILKAGILKLSGQTVPDEED